MQEGHLGTYRITFMGRGSDGGTYVEVTVHNGPDGLVVTDCQFFVGTPGGSALPTLLLIAAVFCLAGYAFFQALPNRFARRCPRDRSILQMREATRAKTSADSP